MYFCLGIISRLQKWFNPTLTVQELTVKLQTLTEMLDIQAEELESKSDGSGYHAKKHLKNGHRSQARFYTKMHLQYLSWSQHLLQYKANLEGLEVRLRQGDNLRKVVGVMEMVQTNLESIQNNLPSIPQLTVQADNLTNTINQFKLASRVTDKTLNPALSSYDVKESVVDETLLQFEEEVGIKFPSPIDAQVIEARQKLHDLGDSQ